MRCKILLLLLFVSILPLTPLAQAKVAYVDPLTGMEFVKVPGGTFIMGETIQEVARPPHKVKVKPFLTGRFEVTFDQYDLFCAATKRELPDDNGWGRGSRPVINVTWQDAVAFTEWLSAQSGRKFRLPSEAEWEFAARGGTTTLFPWGNELGENLANCNGCGSAWDNKSTAPAGSFKPNGYGLYDVVGNVYEWVLDLRHDSYQGAPATASPWLQGNTTGERIYRSASFLQRPREMTVSRRCWDNPEIRKNEIGFRVVLDP